MGIVMTRRAVLAALTIGLLVLGAALSQARPQPASAGVPCPAPLVLDNTYGRFLDAPLVIPDNDPGGVSTCMTISSSQTIGDLNAGLAIVHRWPGDLIVTLTHEDTGTTVTLMDRPGVPATGVGCGEEGDDISAILDDEAASLVENVCAPATPTIDGTFRPNQPLSAFDGESLGGRWTLLLRDGAVGDTGALNAWSIVVGGSGSAGDVNCSGNVNSIDAALVLQLVAELTASLPCMENADVNGSGNVNSIDAALILQRVAGLIPSP